KINYKYEAFQFILKAQVKVLILEKHFPKEYANVIKSLWILFINSNSSNNEELLIDISKRENEEWAKLRKEPFFQKYENAFFNEFIKDNRTISMNDSIIMKYLIVILYLGCIWLRMPILVSDFNYWLCHEEIPFSTAIYCVPESILRKITKLDHLLFKPRSYPTCEWIERKSCEIASFFRKKYHVIFPEVNVPLVLFRYTNCLALPPEMYLIIMRYIKLAKLEFTISKEKSPYIILLAVIIFCIKLVYGLDGVKR
ncbi:hypothetical protein BCR36DRAFT_277741, partial [Piromyces finnis]